MASQRVTIAKIGGKAGDIVLERLREWAGARQIDDPTEWRDDQWPASVRSQAAAFAERLRANALFPPVVHFVEWSDLWSMFDVYTRWLTPPNCPPPLEIDADRFEIFAYELPDGGRLERHLKKARRQQFPECDQYVTRLKEAVGAWGELVERSALIVVREVVGGLVTDEELVASLSVVPDWLREEGKLE